MRTRNVLAGVAALALVAGCAAQIKSLEPKLELRDAFQHLADAKQAGFTLKFTGDADALIAEAQKQTDTGEGDDTKQLRSLFNSSVTIAYDKAGDGPDDDRMSLAATVDGVTGTEIRVVDKIVYAKAPVAELAKKFEAGDVSEIRGEAVAEQPAFGAFFDGKWVAVDLKDAAGLTGKSTGLPTEDLDSAKTLAEVQTGARNLLDGASIVRDSADAKHLVVTTSTTKAYAEVNRLITAVGKDAAGLTDEIGKAPKERPIVLDLWIDKGNLTAAEVNVLQFVDGATGRAAVRLDVTTGTTIDAPDGATKVDLAGLGAVGPGTGGASATEAAQMLGYVAMDMAEEEGGKPADQLKVAIGETGTTARIVRRGVAEVTVKGAKACVKLPASSAGEPKVVKGAC